MSGGLGAEESNRGGYVVSSPERSVSLGGRKHRVGQLGWSPFHTSARVPFVCSRPSYQAAVWRQKLLICQSSVEDYGALKEKCRRL